MTTVFDAAGKGSAKASWALMGRARADTVEPQSAAAKPSPFSRDASCKIKKPDMYWSAPRGAVRPVISAVEIGYVRRSESKSSARRSGKHERRVIARTRRGVPFGTENPGGCGLRTKLAEREKRYSGSSFLRPSTRPRTLSTRYGKMPASLDDTIRHYIENHLYTAAAIALGLGWLIGRPQRPF